MSIKKLSPLLANQIAAGEVVERPSSVVKELLENAIDAGATRIQLDIERGGTRLIRVTDDGHGIEREQLELALARHATSKIEHTEDLKAIHTLGFRGEALASISSVARLSLSSKAAGDDNESTGWSAIAQGQDMAVELQPRPMPVGTIVEVKDLFFNTPARQKFLRAERTEYVHIEETLKRVALASPQVAFTLKHNGKVTKRIPAAQSPEQQKQRIGAIVSNRFLSQALYLDASIDKLRLWGWVSHPEHHQNSNLSQYVFVNGRAVRDRTLNHAIRQAYQDLLPTGRVPAYVLYLELDAEQVDVNVHPTKHEVRFSDARQVHDFISRAVADCLEPQSESLNASELRQVEEVKGAYEPRPSSNLQKDEYYHPRLEAGVAVEQESRQQWSQEKRTQEQGAHLGARQSTVRERHYQSYGPRASSHTTAKAGSFIVVNDQYLMQPEGNGLVVLDVKGFWLGYTADLLKKEWQADEVKVKPLLIPQRLGVPVDDIPEELIQAWSELGFDLNVTGPRSVALRKVPASLMHIDTQLMVQELLYELCQGSDWLSSQELQAHLLKALPDYWQPQPECAWFELLQPLGWRDSIFCHKRSSRDIGAWLAAQSKESSQVE